MALPWSSASRFCALPPHHGYLQPGGQSFVCDGDGGEWINQTYKYHLQGANAPSKVYYFLLFQRWKLAQILRPDYQNEY